MLPKINPILIGSCTGNYLTAITLFLQYSSAQLCAQGG